MMMMAMEMKLGERTTPEMSGKVGVGVRRVWVWSDLQIGEDWGHVTVVTMRTRDCARVCV